MGVEVVWTTERREPKQMVVDSHHVVSRLAATRWPKLNETTCLRFVDVCGDAVFNQAQLPVLLDELRAEALLLAASRDREHLEKVIQLIETALGKTHTYIVFAGD